MELINIFVADLMQRDGRPSEEDGIDESWHGEPCDGTDSDLCPDEAFLCSGAVQVCEDNPSDFLDLCDGVDNDCDGSIDEDFDRDTNPNCIPDQINLGVINGDTGGTTLYRFHYSEEWIRIRIREDDEIYDRDLSARLTLTSPPGVDFDLYVYCESCGGSLAGSSTSGGSLDTVDVRRDDTAGHDDEFDILVRVLHYSSSYCAYWQLEVLGNSGAPSETCPWDPGAAPSSLEMERSIRRK